MPFAVLVIVLSVGGLRFLLWMVPVLSCRSGHLVILTERGVGLVERASFEPNAAKKILTSLKSILLHFRCQQWDRNAK